MRLFLITRHGQSTLNVEQRINGDPGVRVDLTEEGLGNARGLGQQIANVPIGLCIHTRFDRTRKTALSSRSRAATFRTRSSRSSTTSTSATWRARRSRTSARGRPSTRARTVPGRGESRWRRPAATSRPSASWPTASTPDVVLIVTHEIPIRYALNARRRLGRPGRADARDPQTRRRICSTRRRCAGPPSASSGSRVRVQAWDADREQ